MTGPVKAEPQKSPAQRAPEQLSTPEQTSVAFPTTPLHDLRTLSRPMPSNGAPHKIRTILNLQRTIGNRATGQLLQRTAGGRIQPKLTVGPAGDMYEREADAAADRVAAGRPVGRLSRLPAAGLHRQPETEVEEPIQRQSAEEEEEIQAVPVQRQEAEAEEPVQASGAEAMVQRMCPACEEKARRQISDEDEEAVQAKGSGSETGLDTATAEQAMARSRSGNPLGGTLRKQMEGSFSTDFSAVRVHSGPAAQEASRAIHARAFTNGADIYLGPGESLANTRLMAHELAHVVQQSSDSVPTLKRQAAAAPNYRDCTVAITGIADADQRPGVIQRAADPSQAPTGMPCLIATDSVASLLDIHFDRDSAAIRPMERAALEAFVVSWHGQPGSPRLRIDGYASVEGREPHNWALSCSRAMAVKNALTSAAVGGNPGIPSGLVEVVAQGETVAFGPARPDNRLATIWSETPQPAPPEPTPTPAPAPAFRCGPDVTAELGAAISRTRSTFAGWSTADREEHCDALDSYRTGGFAWDVVELHNNGWILSYRPACATVGATPLCGSTVQVDSECSYAGSPNYVIYGTMCDLCHGHYVGTGNTAGQRRFTQSAMLGWIDFYKGPGVLSSAAGNYRDSRRWASAGYRGWPAVASPPGDRPGCDPSCPTPHTVPAFRVAWWRNPGWLSMPSRTVI